MTAPRLLLLACCFAATAFVSARAMRPEVVPLREPLSDLPTKLDTWFSKDAPPLADDIVSTLGVDEYTNRLYSAPGGIPISLYVGFYGSQRQGDTIHSPLNCLPGAGWQAVSRETVTMPVAGRAEGIGINRFLIQKGLDRQVVLYWYQSHGRVIASEYASKAYLVWDALRLHRSDAALVRVITPILARQDSEAAADERARRFVSALFPHLERFLPS